MSAAAARRLAADAPASGVGSVHPASPAAGGARGAGRAGSSDRLTLALLLLGLMAWSGWFIYRTSFVADGKRVFCLFDDAMISMTYARNLVEGHGLNWAREGRPVEGFTHPLWTALMVPVNLLPVDLRWRSLAVQLLSLAALAMNVVLVRRLMLSHFATAEGRHWLPAAALTACYYPLDYWSLLGMESGLQALLTTASVLLALDIVWRGENRHRELLLLGAAAYLLRMDMLVVIVVTQLYVLAGRLAGWGERGGGGDGGGRTGRGWRGWHGWRELPAGERRAWFQGVALFGAAVGGYGVFRWLYFHDVLPNTYYLKLAQIPLDVRLRRGGRVLFESLLDHWALLAAVAFGAAVVAVFGAGRRELFRRLALPAAVLLAACAYSVYVGGDAWEMEIGLNVRANRFVAFAMPQLFVIFNALLNARSRRAPAGLASVPAGGGSMIGWRKNASAAAVTILAALAADGLLFADVEPLNLEALLVRSPPFLVPMHADVYGKLRGLQAVLAPGALLATSSAGIPAYFSDYRLVDLYGYNERHVARLPPAFPLNAENYMALLPGHVKYDCAYVLERYHPDAFLVPSRPGPPAPAALLVAAGYRFDKEGGYWLPAGDRRGRRNAT